MADTIKIHINPADTRISEDGLRLIKEWVLKKIGKVSNDLKYTANLVVPSVGQLPAEGNPEYVYMVGPLPDSTDSDGLYDVYAWIDGEYEKLTTLNNSMIGFWKGSPTVEGEGNVVTGIKLSNDGNTVVVSKGINALVKEDISGLESDIDEIRGYISPAAREDNKLTDKEYVDNQIGTLSARYLASDENGNPFATYAAFSAEGVKFYYAGEEVSAAKNDYAIVSADESEQGKGGVTRYWYTGTDWSFQYIVNTSPFTTDEWAAIQSGITKERVEKYDGYEDIIPTKTSELTNDSNFITLNDIPPVKMDSTTIIGSGTDESPFSAAGMKGATESAEGSGGIVPAPAAPDMVLTGDGLWKNVEIIDKAFINSLDWSNLPMVKIGAHYYHYVKIGRYYYTTENLREQTAGYKTWGISEEECLSNGYGYSYEQNSNTINALSAVIPSGWSLCTYDSLNNLVDTAGGSTLESARKLMSITGWTGYAGTDIYGFNAKPAGYYSLWDEWAGKGTTCCLGSKSFDGIYYHYLRIAPGSTSALIRSYQSPDYGTPHQYAQRACKLV